MVFIKAGGYGGIGRRDGFRCRWETVQVRVLLSALVSDNLKPVPIGADSDFQYIFSAESRGGGIIVDAAAFEDTLQQIED